jgi:RNA polymerase sigma-70 factor (ECF subfamily)
MSLTTGTASDERPSLESLLRERLAAARARFPAVKLDDEAFFEGLRARAPKGADDLAALHTDDLFIALACARGDRAAIAELEASVLSQVPRWLGRFEGLGADEVQQELRQKLLIGQKPHLLDYGGRGALDRWIRVAATRCAIDLQRRQKPVEDDAVEQLLAGGPDPEIDFVKLHDREALRAVLRDAVRGLPPRDLSLLRLHYLEGLSLEKLAALERVHRATVARWLADARAAALQRVHELLRERLRLNEREGESLLRLVRSRLDLSLRGAFSSSSG